MYTNTGATLYNYDRDKSTGKVTYRRTTLENVFWDDSKQSNTMKSGLTSIESVKVCVPFDVKTNNKKYASPKAYLNSADKDSLFTFVANSQDLIVKGIIEYEIDNTSNQTISESLSYMKNNFDYVMTVSVVDMKDFGSERMQHWELGGK